MSMPKQGLYYEDAKRRLLKYKTALQNPNMRNALIDDVRIAEGEGAARELTEEVYKKRFSGGKDYTPRGKKNCLWNPKPKFTGEGGRYKLVDGEWVKQ